MAIKQRVQNLLNKLPYIRGLYQQTQNSAFPNGHFYSPVISIKEIKEREDAIWKKSDPVAVAGIDLRADEQAGLLKEFEKFYQEMPFEENKSDRLRYYFENDYYKQTDGIVLYSLIRHFKPKRIIEIGSGFSSAVMLDTNELFFNSTIDLTFIDPYPQRLQSLLRPSDKSSTKVIESDVQLISLETFDRLESGDILFVDSTHVSKTGSDVNYIVFDILPRLKSGVVIHFHDVFYPFEYPKEWVFKGFNWNEDYFLRAFLMYNSQFSILLFSDYMHKMHPQSFKNMPLTYKNFGGNIWLRKA